MKNNLIYLMITIFIFSIATSCVQNAYELKQENASEFSQESANVYSQKNVYELRRENSNKLKKGMSVNDVNKLMGIDNPYKRVSTESKDYYYSEWLGKYVKMSYALSNTNVWGKRTYEIVCFENDKLVGLSDDECQKLHQEDIDVKTEYTEDLNLKTKTANETKHTTDLCPATLKDPGWPKGLFEDCKLYESYKKKIEIDFENKKDKPSDLVNLYIDVYNHNTYLTSSFYYHKYTELEAIVKDRMEYLALNSMPPYPQYVWANFNISLGENYQRRATQRPEFRQIYTDMSRKYFETGIEWLKKTIDFSDSAELLGEVYEKGLGVEKSNYLAIKYYSKAGISYLDFNYEDEAIKMLEKINNLNPNHPLGKELAAKIYKKANPDTEKEETTSMGTGWVCKYGNIVTNYHVIEGKDKISIKLTNGKSVGVSIVVKDKFNDIVILSPKDKSQLPPAIPLCNGKKAPLGSEVFTIGFPHPDIMGTSQKVTSGRISSLTGVDDDPRTYQISVPIQSGNSGGALINMNGEVVGIVKSKLSAAKIFNWTGDLPQNVNYAIKVRYLNLLMEDINSTNKNIRLLPAGKDKLEKLVARVSNSVVMVIAK
jgi:S1-C subfamily serine protease